jgi:hypothetical protein
MYGVCLQVKYVVGYDYYPRKYCVGRYLSPTHNSVTVNNGASPTCSRRALQQPHRRPISIRDPCWNLGAQAQCSKLPRGAHTTATPTIDGRRHCLLSPESETRKQSANTVPN